MDGTSRDGFFSYPSFFSLRGFPFELELHYRILPALPRCLRRIATITCYNNQTSLTIQRYTAPI